MSYFDTDEIASKLQLTASEKLDCILVCTQLENELKNMGIIYEATPTERTYRLRGAVNGKSLFQFPANLTVVSATVKSYVNSSINRVLTSSDYELSPLPIPTKPNHILELNSSYGMNRVDNYNSLLDYDQYIEIKAKGGYGSITDIPANLQLLAVMETQAYINLYRNTTNINAKSTITSRTIGKVSVSSKAVGNNDTSSAIINLRKSIYQYHNI